jgi:hypothetical protein
MDRQIVSIVRIEAQRVSRDDEGVPDEQRPREGGVKR